MRSAVSQLRALPPASSSCSWQCRGGGVPLQFISFFFFIAEIISGRPPGSWQGAQLSCKCNCGGYGSREEQAAGTWGPSPPQPSEERLGQRPRARAPTVQAVGLSLPTQARGLTLSLEDKEVCEAREREGGVCSFSAVEDSGTQACEEPSLGVYPRPA